MALFDGKTYEAKRDERRLATLFSKVLFLMADGAWRTLAEIRTKVDLGTEASISARLRDLRKDKFGGFTVERRRRGAPADGLFEYRVIQPDAQPAATTQPEIPNL